MHVSSFHIQKSVENALSCINAPYKNKELLLEIAAVGKFAPLSVNSKHHQFLSINIALHPPPPKKRSRYVTANDLASVLASLPQTSRLLYLVNAT